MIFNENKEIKIDIDFRNLPWILAPLKGPKIGSETQALDDIMQWNQVFTGPF